MIDDTKVAEVDIRLIRHKMTKRTFRPLLNNGMKIEELNASDKDTYTETLPDGKTIEWVLPHKKTFPAFINKHFGENPVYVSNKHMFLKSIAESTDESPPFSYQIIIRDYLKFGTPYRSLLLEHGLGSGKSRSAIMVAETFREQGLPILILTPAFLRLNFMDEIQKWGGDDIKITATTPPADAKHRQSLIDKSYQFVHYNATGYSVNARHPKTGEDIGGKGGVFEQLARLGIGFPEDSKYGKLFPYLNKKYGPLKPPTNMLIIIEEIHNLNRTFVSGTTKSNLKFFMYPLLLMASDCKIIGLSGTPIISSPFEMATLYNVLRGPMKTGDPARPVEYTLPQSEARFNELFVNYEGLSLTNKELMMSHIIGLGSLFKGVTEDVDRIIFPAGKDTPIIEEIEMSTYQSRVHDMALAKELQKKAKRRREVNLTGTEGGDLVSPAQSAIDPEPAYHSNSRQAINFAFPRDIPRPRPRDKVSFITPALVQYELQFSDSPDRIFRKMRENGVDISDNEAAFKEATSETEKRSILSTLFKKAYPTISSDSEKEWAWLSTEDQQMIERHMGSYSTRLQAAIQALADKPEDYLTLKNLEKYSVKMARIYRYIVGDTAHGAAHVIKDDKKLQAEEATIPVCEEYEEPLLETEPEMEVSSAEDEDIDLNLNLNLTAKRVTDPEDELPKYMDVFKTDAELEKMGMRVTGGPALVYSFFNTVEGAGIFSKVLEAHGFAPFTDQTWDGVTPFENMERVPRYAFIKGGMNPRLKAKVMRVFNSRANRHGQLIRVVFVTQAAAEGISLYHLRQIHIMEPHWDNVLIEQVIGRGFRLRSHRYLADKREREIQVYQYFAKRSSKVDADYWSKVSLSPGQETVDYIVKGIADRKAKLVSDLKLIRGAAAIDCKINSDYNALGVQCFDFRGNTQGNAFTADLEIDVEASRHVKKTVETAITYNHFQFEDARHGMATYITYPGERVSIKITRQGKSTTKEAGVFYSVPEGWKVGDHVDPHDFKKRGYTLGNVETKQLMFLDDVSRLGGTIEEI